MVIREVDPQKLGLTDKLIEVMEEAKACGARQPVVIAGDLNARDPCFDHGYLKWTVCVWPLCPACSTTASDKSGSSSTKEVQAIWEINLEISQFVPLEIEKLHLLSHSDLAVDLASRACALMLSRV